MFQHDNAPPHATRICTQFLEAENIPVLPWPAYSPDMSPIEHVWDALDGHVCTGSTSACSSSRDIQQLRTAIEEVWDNIPQATINSRSILCEGDVFCCLRQMVVTPDTDWFSDARPYLLLLLYL